MTDSIFAMIKEWDPSLELKYNKLYLKMAKQGQPNLFVLFRPQKAYLRLEVRLTRLDEADAKPTQSGLELMDYESRWGRYRIRLGKTDVKKHEGFLRDIIKLAYNEATK